MARVNGGYQPTQPLPKREPELTFNHSAHIIAITTEKVRKEALRMISGATKNMLIDRPLESIGYIAGVAGLANALIGEEDDE